MSAATPPSQLASSEATPINPSDLGLLIGPADMSTANVSGTKDTPVVTAKMPEAAMRMMAARLDQSLPVGNEGAGVVVKTGSSDAAKALMGKNVSMITKEEGQIGAGDQGKSQPGSGVPELGS